MQVSIVQFSNFLYFILLTLQRDRIQVMSKYYVTGQINKYHKI